MPLAALALLLAAADAPRTADVPLARPKDRRDVKANPPYDAVRISVWTPDGGPVRGAVVNPFGPQLHLQKGWQDAARVWGFAVVGADYSGVGKAEYGPTLAAGLKKVGLEQAPLLFVGSGEGAAAALAFADALPGRTVAVAAVGVEAGPGSDAARTIPTLTVVGERDGKLLEAAAGRHDAERRRGSLWAVAPLWGRRGELGPATGLVMPFFDDAVRRRLPADADPTKGPVKLRAVVEGDGWHCDSGFEKPLPRIANAGRSNDGPAGRNWFPGEASAAACQGLMVRVPKLVIRAPRPPADGDPFGPMKARQGFRATVAGAKGYAKVGLRDGSDVIGEGKGKFEVTEVPVPAGLSEGVHVLTAVGWDAKGGLADISRPVCVIVAR
jgi:hypothetical protein